MRILPILFAIDSRSSFQHGDASNDATNFFKSTLSRLPESECVADVAQWHPVPVGQRKSVRVSCVDEVPFKSIGSRLFWDVSKHIKVDEGESDRKKYALVFGACLTSIENPCLVWEFGKNCFWKKNKGVSTIDESKPIREYKTEYTIHLAQVKNAATGFPHFLVTTYMYFKYPTILQQQFIYIYMYIHRISYNCINTHTFLLVFGCKGLPTPNRVLDTLGHAFAGHRAPLWRHLRHQETAEFPMENGMKMGPFFVGKWVLKFARFPGWRESRSREQLRLQSSSQNGQRSYWSGFGSLVYLYVPYIYIYYIISIHILRDYISKYTVKQNATNNQYIIITNCSCGDFKVYHVCVVVLLDNYLHLKIHMGSPPFLDTSTNSFTVRKMSKASGDRWRPGHTLSTNHEAMRLGFFEFPSACFKNQALSTSNHYPFQLLGSKITSPNPTWMCSIVAPKAPGGSFQPFSVSLPPPKLPSQKQRCCMLGPSGGPLLWRWVHLGFSHRQLHGPLASIPGAQGNSINQCPISQHVAMKNADLKKKNTHIFPKILDWLQD